MLSSSELEEVQRTILHAIATSPNARADVGMPEGTTESRRETNEQVAAMLHTFAAENGLELRATSFGFSLSPALELVELTPEQADGIALRSHAHIALAGFTAGGGLGMVSVQIRDKESTIMLFQQDDEPIFGWRINGGDIRARKARVQMTKENLERSLANHE